MSETTFLDVPGQRRRRNVPDVPPPFGRSLSFDGPKSPRSVKANGVELLSKSYDQRRPLSSAASCNRGPVTSHPMIQRRPPPPYARLTANDTHNSSLDSLENTQHDISSSSVNSSEVSTPPDGEFTFEEEIRLRNHRLDIRKSKSDEEVTKKFTTSETPDEVDGMLKLLSPLKKKKVPTATLR